MRVFISHSSKDAALAAEVCSKIEFSGHRCFLAPRDIRSGYEYAEEIINGIDSSDVILLLLSQAANDSPHVLREIERAVSKKKSIIVYRLEDVTLSKSMEYFLMTHQWLNSDGSSNFEDIILRINEFAAQSGGNTSAPEPAAPSPAPVATKSSSRRRNIIIITAAAVILAAAGVIAGFCLANRAPADNGHGGAPNVPAAAMEQNTPAPDKQNNTPPEEPSRQESTSTKSKPDTQEAAPPLNEPGMEPAADSQPNEAPAAPETDPLKPQSEPQLPVADPPAQTTSAPPQDTPAPKMTSAAVELGDSMMFGTYLGEPIEWRVIRISEDGTQAVVIANDILTMKAYDAADGGEYNKYGGEDYWSTRPQELDPEVQRQIRGDNRWELSNIRTWLNSERENVVYNDQAPTSNAMSEKRNGYHTEAGFLNGFTKAERAALLETQVVTNGTATSDKVFLLSSEELDWLYEADVSIYAKPTAAAVEQDTSYWYKVDSDAYGVTDFIWWLRDANPDNSCECWYINLSCSDKRISSGSVGLEGYGIRPVTTLDLTSDAVKKALENSHGTD